MSPSHNLGGIIGLGRRLHFAESESERRAIQVESKKVGAGGTSIFVPKIPAGWPWEAAPAVISQITLRQSFSNLPIRRSRNRLESSLEGSSGKRSLGQCI